MKGILTKIFGARDKLTRRRGVSGKEMPFLDHLEELRQMLVKIIATLIVATIGAFVFRAPLMEFIKRPVELAGLGASIKLPDEVSKREWRKVQKLAKTAQELDPAVRDVFLKSALAEEEKALRLYVEALPVFNATLVLDRKERQAFVNGAVTDDAPLRETVLKLVRKNPGAKVDRQGNLIEMSALRPPEAFMLSLKIALITGMIISFPLLLYFIAQFVFPGLTPKEKRAVLPALGIGFGLFLSGAAFAYWIVTPRVLEFFHEYADGLGVASEWRIGYYVSFVSQLVLIFGVCFELPVVVMTLVKIGLLGHEFMARNRSYAVIIIFTVAAIITPTPDAPTLCLLAVPMVILYEICIWMAYFIERRRRRLEAEEEAEEAMARRKRVAARELAMPPAALPVGTRSHEGEAALSDESVSEAFAENDALREEDDDGPGEGQPEYEDGFGPRQEPGVEAETDEEEGGDPHSSDDLHNERYEEGDHPAQDEASGDADGGERVDDEPKPDQREEGDPPSIGDAEPDASPDGDPSDQD